MKGNTGVVMRNKSSILISICIMLFVLADAASACTGVYVGSQVSADGTVIFGRSNDYQVVWGNHIVSVPHIKNKKGRTLPVNDSGSVQAPLPATTYHYTATPWMDSTVAYNGLARDATVGANEYGVAMTMAVTADSNSRALDADPLVKDGLTERTTVDLVICQSSTARQAVEVLLGIIDTYGSGECNVAVIADQKEAWYVEMYTGHQYAAVRLPQDKVSVFGNEFTMEYLSEFDQSIVSKDLLALPEQRGFAVYGKNKELNLYETYSGDTMAKDYNQMRTWIGHRILAPSAYGAYELHKNYPLCFTPDKKVSLEDVFSIMRNRYEGTEFSPDETGRTDIRVIGTDTAMSVHVVQVYPDLPPAVSCVTWESSGPAIYGVFVPVSNGCRKVNSAYGANQPKEAACIFDTEHYPYYVMKGLASLCVGHENHAVYGQPVREYWRQAENAMMQGMSQVLKNASGLKAGKAAEIINNYCDSVQNQAFSDGKKILNDLLWTIGKNSNTLRKEAKKKLEISLDASAYMLK